MPRSVASLRTPSLPPGELPALTAWQGWAPVDRPSILQEFDFDIDALDPSAAIRDKAYQQAIGYHLAVTSQHLLYFVNSKHSQNVRIPLDQIESVDVGLFERGSKITQISLLHLQLTLTLVDETAKPVHIFAVQDPDLLRDVIYDLQHNLRVAAYTVPQATGATEVALKLDHPAAAVPSASPGISDVSLVSSFNPLSSPQSNSPNKLQQWRNSVPTTPTQHGSAAALEHQLPEETGYTRESLTTGADVTVDNSSADLDNLFGLHQNGFPVSRTAEHRAEAASLVSNSPLKHRYAEDSPDSPRSVGLLLPSVADKVPTENLQPSMDCQLKPHSTGDSLQHAVSVPVQVVVVAAGHVDPNLEIQSLPPPAPLDSPRQSLLQPSCSEDTEQAPRTRSTLAPPPQPLDSRAQSLSTPLGILSHTAVARPADVSSALLPLGSHRPQAASQQQQEQGSTPDAGYPSGFADVPSYSLALLPHPGGGSQGSESSPSATLKTPLTSMDMVPLTPANTLLPLAPGQSDESTIQQTPSSAASNWAVAKTQASPFPPPQPEDSLLLPLDSTGTGTNPLISSPATPFHGSLLPPPQPEDSLLSPINSSLIGSSTRGSHPLPGTTSRFAPPPQPDDTPSQSLALPVDNATVVTPESASSPHSVNFAPISIPIEDASHPLCSSSLSVTSTQGPYSPSLTRLSPFALASSQSTASEDWHGSVTSRIAQLTQPAIEVLGFNAADRQPADEVHNHGTQAATIQPGYQPDMVDIHTVANNNLQKSSPGLPAIEEQDGQALQAGSDCTAYATPVRQTAAEQLELQQSASSPQASTHDMTPAWARSTISNPLFEAIDDSPIDNPLFHDSNSLSSSPSRLPNASQYAPSSALCTALHPPVDSPSDINAASSYDSLGFTARLAALPPREADSPLSPYRMGQVVTANPQDIDTGSTAYGGQPGDDLLAVSCTSAGHVLQSTGLLPQDSSRGTSPGQKRHRSSSGLAENVVDVMQSQDTNNMMMRSASKRSASPRPLQQQHPTRLQDSYNHAELPLSASNPFRSCELPLGTQQGGELAPSSLPHGPVPLEVHPTAPPSSVAGVEAHAPALTDSNPFRQLSMSATNDHGHMEHLSAPSDVQAVYNAELLQHHLGPHASCASPPHPGSSGLTNRDGSISYPASHSSNAIASVPHPHMTALEHAAAAAKANSPAVSEWTDYSHDAFDDYAGTPAATPMKQLLNTPQLATPGPAATPALSHITNYSNESFEEYEGSMQPSPQLAADMKRPAVVSEEHAHDAETHVSSHSFAACHTGHQHHQMQVADAAGLYATACQPTHEAVSTLDDVQADVQPAQHPAQEAPGCLVSDTASLGHDDALHSTAMEPEHPPPPIHAQTPQPRTPRGHAQATSPCMSSLTSSTSGAFGNPLFGLAHAQRQQGTGDALRASVQSSNTTDFHLSASTHDDVDEQSSHQTPSTPSTRYPSSMTDSFAASPLASNPLFSSQHIHMQHMQHPLNYQYFPGTQQQLHSQQQQQHTEQPVEHVQTSQRHVTSDMHGSLDARPFDSESIMHTPAHSVEQLQKLSTLAENGISLVAMKHVLSGKQYPARPSGALHRGPPKPHITSDTAHKPDTAYASNSSTSTFQSKPESQLSPDRLSPNTAGRLLANAGHQMGALVGEGVDDDVLYLLSQAQSAILQARESVRRGDNDWPDVVASTLQYVQVALGAMQHHTIDPPLALAQ